MNTINNVISEEISKYLINEDKSKSNDLMRSLQNFLEKVKKRKKRKNKKRKRKLSHGGFQYYDYDEYEKSHKKASKSDTYAVINRIDQEKTDIAAVAREVFPNHTEEGAQSQLRKILNHERPMTKDVETKLEKMIANGSVALK